MDHTAGGHLIRWVQRCSVLGPQLLIWGRTMTSPNANRKPRRLLETIIEVPVLERLPPDSL
jgi:hypothetical protein